MTRFPLSALLALAILPAVATHARTTCSDPGAAAAVRALVAEQCDCASVPSRKVYLRCARAVIASAIADGRLPVSCGGDVSRCASVSTCGRPGAVACCTTFADGKKKCKIRPSAAKCVAPAGQRLRQRGAELLRRL
jgi:hypothetical protein